jgi:hypothetical protein
VQAACSARGIGDYFCFDMSIPDARAYLQRGMPVFGRLSELEPPAAFTRSCAGIWLDAFESCWFDVRNLRSWQAEGRDVCVVSPELHGRDPDELWRGLRAEVMRVTGAEGGAGVAGARQGRIMLCTDLAPAWRGRQAA